MGVALLAVSSAFAGVKQAAAVPATVPYVGYLTHESGAPFNGDVAVSIALFDAADGTLPLWGPNSLDIVSVSSGILSFVIGGSGPLSLDTALLANQVWLEITIGSEVLSPRQRIHAVPYAMVAGDAEQLGGHAASTYPRWAELPDLAASSDVADLTGDFAGSSLGDAFVKRGGDSMTGDLDLALNRLLYARMHINAGPPAPCTALTSGLYYFDSVLLEVQICTGADWLSISAETPPALLPVLTLDAPTLVVAPITGGATPGACTSLLVQNTGTGAATNLTLGAFTGANPSNFEGCQASAGPCGTSLAAGESCNFGIRLAAVVNASFSATAHVTADGASASRAVSGDASGFGLALVGAYSSTDAASGEHMHVVPVPTPRTITTLADYHATCQEYGLSAYDTSDTNPACFGTDGLPLRVGSCNMGVFNSAGWDYRFDVPVPTLSHVYWIAVSTSGSFGMEWNAVGPCSANEQVGACGTGSVGGNGNGMRHSKNPIYGANYNVQNIAMTTSDFIVCTDTGPPQPAIFLESPTLAVAPITDGTSPGACTALPLSNNGLAPASGMTITGFSGTNAANFEACNAPSNPCGSTLGAGASCNLGVRLSAAVDGVFVGTVEVGADGGLTASRGVWSESNGIGGAGTVPFVATDAGSGHSVHLVPIPTDRVISTIEDYHATCQEVGLSAYGTSDTNAACVGAAGYPVRVSSCNMGAFNFGGFDYRFDTPVPAINRVYWMAVLQNPPVVGFEWNAVGPCAAGEEVGGCGTGSLNGNGNGMRHSKNPLYSANYDVQNGPAQ